MRLSVLAGLALLAVLLAPVAGVQAAPTAATLTDTRCTLRLPGYSEGADYSCAVLTTLERHDGSTAGQVRLPVVIVGGTNVAPGTPPLLMLQGGPGSSGARAFLRLLLPGNGVRSPLLDGRDVVILEQRGTPTATPALVCRGNLATTNPDGSPMSRDQVARATGAYYAACRAMLDGQGIDVAAYNTAENAADINDLRLALGKQQLDLYGVSYGSYLVQEVLRSYPGTVRAAVLDSVVPPQVSFLREEARSFNNVLNLMMDTCKFIQQCARLTDFEKDLFDLVNRLDVRPERLQLRDAQGRAFFVDLNGDRVLQIVFASFYDSDLFPVMFQAVAEAREGDYRIWRSLVSSMFSGGGGDIGTSTGMYYSVTCAEWPPFALRDTALGDIRTRVAQYLEGQLLAHGEACRAWNVPARYPASNQLVQSDVPTLILSGAFDHITPPEFGVLVSQGLSRSRHYVMLASAHATIGDGCAEGLMQAFLANPDATPATPRCANRLR